MSKEWFRVVSNYSNETAQFFFSTKFTISINQFQLSHKNIESCYYSCPLSVEAKKSMYGQSISMANFTKIWCSSEIIAIFRSIFWWKTFFKLSIWLNGWESWLCKTWIFQGGILKILKSKNTFFFAKSWPNQMEKCAIFCQNQTVSNEFSECDRVAQGLQIVCMCAKT